MKKIIVIAAALALLVFVAYGMAEQDEKETSAVQLICIQATARAGVAVSECDKEKVSSILHKLQSRKAVNPETLKRELVSTADAYTTLSTLVRASDGMEFVKTK